jgi:predicted ferric reductase
MIGTNHRRPHSSGAGIVPTRGQTLFIGYLVLINVLVCVVDFHPGPQPNAWFSDTWQQMMCYLGDRAGSLCFANLCLMLLYSARNNLLLQITDWSHTTYLLLHRWVGYIAIIEGAVHCLVWLHWYVKLGTHNEEAKEAYWYWGIISMLAMSLIYPLSLLPVRRRLYEFFLLSHIALTILVITGNYLHVWYLYENNWGYEIWMYTAGAVWGADRAIRIWRTFRNGVRYADVTKIDDDYVRLDIDGVVAHGHVYLYFPTLRLAFWENHPFSVASSFAGRREPLPMTHAVQSTSVVEKEKTTIAANVTGSDQPEVDSSENISVAIPRPRLTFVVRVQKGITQTLASRVSSSIPVLVESSYYSHPQESQLAHCTTLLCIAGGVGVTTVLPLMRTLPAPRARLYWGMRYASLKDALADETAGLDLVYSIGQRLDLRTILEEELLRRDEGGLLGVVVSGPAGMADEVRDIFCQINSSGRAARGAILIDEAFSW